MSKALFATATLAALFLGAGPAAAQTRLTGDPVSDAQAAMNEAVKPSKVSAQAGAATLADSVSLPEGLEITTDDDKTEATAKFSIKLTEGNGLTRFVSVTGKAQLDKDKIEGDTPLGILKGLGRANSLEVKFSQSRLTGTHPAPDTPEAEKTWQEVCAAVVAAHAAQPAKAPKGIDAPDCANDSMSGIWVDAYASDADLIRFRRLNIDEDAAIEFLGFAGAVGRETFKFRDPSTLAELEEEETPWSAGFYWARHRLSSGTLITARFDHKRLYEAAKEEIRCANPADQSTCLKAPFGMPKKKDVDVVSVEVRKRLGDIGLSLTAGYDVGDENFAIDLPIYFIKDGQDGFNGGVRATWDSKSNDAKVAFFMNKAFSFFGGL
jgi:hypothetical protein